jgi:hypothetical protein
MLSPKERWFPHERVIRETKLTCLLIVCMLSLLALVVLGAQLWV